MPAIKYADETEVKTTHWMLPEMANPVGNIFGGQIMMLIDQIAYICAARYANNKQCATAAMDRLDLHEPVRVGELLTLVARITRTGRSSMDVEINAYAETIDTGQVRLTHTSYLRMVSLRNGKSAPVPRLVCRTALDKARFLQASMRHELQDRYRHERDHFVDEFARMDDAQLDALIAARHNGDGAGAPQ